MCDSDSLERKSRQPLAKKEKSHNDILTSDSSQDTQQSSQWLQNIIIATGHNQDQSNLRHTINVIVKNKKKGRQQRYREQNREKLKQREAERRKRILYSRSIARPSSSPNINRIKLNNEEILDADSQSSSGLEGTQTSSIQRNQQTQKKNLQKQRERQQRYREQNREKLKQREAERRRRLQNSGMIPESSTSPNIEFIEIKNEQITDEINTNSQSVDGAGEMQHLSIERSQQNERGQSSEYETQIPNNYSKFRCHKHAHKYFNDNLENNQFGHVCPICDPLWVETDLNKSPASANIINTIPICNPRMHPRFSLHINQR